MSAVHCPSSLDSAPPAASPRSGKEGISTPPRPRPEYPNSRDLFEVDFDPKRNYLRELKNERGGEV